MADHSNPINIATRSPNNLTSPRNLQNSNLTSALQSTTGNGRRSSLTASIMAGNGKYGAGGRHDSVGATSGMGPSYGTGAQPISMGSSNRPRDRRESVAGSMTNGMSWGGVSVGSWIRDDVIMQGTSPFPYKSPSFHSSSYMPKLEAQFMKDFQCCDLVLPTLHDLIQHFEEAHAPPFELSKDQTINQQTNLGPNPKAALAASTATAIAQQNPTFGQTSSIQQASMGQNRSNNTALQNMQSNSALGPQSLQYSAGHYGLGNQQNLQSMGDMDVTEDMEMDDIPEAGFGGVTANIGRATTASSQRSQFGQGSSGRVAPLELHNTSYGTAFQGLQGLRNSQPATPNTGGRPGVVYQNNPTVSSVNTPTLTTHPRNQAQFRNSPDSSAPGTPAELDPDFLGNIGNMSMTNANLAQFMATQQYDSSVFPNGSDMLDYCIDEPAKRLFSPGGPNNAAVPANQRLGSAQYGPNSEIARRIREQQARVGLADTTSGIHGEEPKPFRCPVIGCEKAYKNQNGLKYHKSHGHNNQQLHENNDGTFSIVDPATLTPYPGTLGMEKEKPFKCEICGKRYKNLNGLKYHKSHSTPCNPDAKPNFAEMGMPSALDGQDLHTSGMALHDIGEEMVQ
ncbi:Transcriptional regulator of ribosomal biogenesis proteins [Agyrium rufum]|nr:Transcriptional regulator of ribosomal biogenesis proteins [Agyrium rufum]